MSPDERTYLGDGLYASFDGYMIGLHANNGIADTNTVWLEPQVWQALERFVASLKGAPR